MVRPHFLYSVRKTHWCRRMLKRFCKPAPVCFGRYPRSGDLSDGSLTLLARARPRPQDSSSVVVGGVAFFPLSAYNPSSL
jgi:hypothetical protein